MIQKKQTKQDLLDLATKNYKRLFVNYDNPTKALETWFEYLPELYHHNIIIQARGIADATENYIDLDSKLSTLLEESHFKQVVKESLVEFDDENKYEMRVISQRELIALEEILNAAK